MTRSAYACGSLLALVVGCGARTPLDPPDGSDGGGGGATTATTSVSTGGGGDGSGTCELVISGAPLGFEDLWPKNPSFWPRLTPVGDSSDRVAVVYRWDGYDKGVSLADIAMSPWGAWGPEMFESAWGINTQNAGEHLVDSAPGDQIAVLTLTGASPALYVIEPSAPSFDNLVLGGGFGIRPLAVSRGISDYLVAYERIENNERLGVMGHVGPNGLVDVDEAIVCANAPLAADAIPTSKGYLAVVSSGRSFGTCLEPSLSSGPPGDMFVLRIEHGVEVASLVKGDPIDYLAIQPRIGGAWIAIRRKGSPLSWQAVDPFGFLETAAQPLGNPPDDAVIATTHAGAWLVAAWADPLGTQELSVVATDGERTLNLAIPGGYDPPDGQVSLLGSPDGRYVLVAWSQLRDELWKRVRLARLELTPSCQSR
ncbi:MAG: hypothetical protein HOV80_38105 [Polyangiaceae bacterium]|nr:hypothetical protein [Polyangiaceae bacterium]